MMKKGFTIVEMMLAVSLFVIVIPIVLGSFVSAMRVQRETTAYLMANSTIGFALEQMTREMRTGSGFYCTAPGNDCGGAASDVVYFTNAAGALVSYRYDNASTPKQIVRSENGGAESAITSPSINIASAEFVVMGNVAYDLADPSADYMPARVTIAVEYNPRMKGRDLPVTRTIQTSVSARFDY
jgi:prepilin-type N-terminal cleavage/methylation domain-containing protein